jgi:hypothetical protein
MQHSRLALLFAASLTAGIITLAACGDDAATPLPGGGSSGVSSSSGKTSSGAAGDDDTTDDDTTGDDDDTTDGGADADCKFAPAIHKTDLGFFCDFYDAGTADSGTGGRSNCAPETVCCNTSAKDGTNFEPTYCAPNTDPGKGPTNCAAAAADFNSVWTPGTAWECGGSSNCPNDLKCCAVSADGADAGNFVNVGPLTGSSAPPKACNAKLLYKSNGTRCLAACDPKKGQLEVCSSTDKCADDTMKCQPVRAGVKRDIGICQK